VGDKDGIPTTVWSGNEEKERVEERKPEMELEMEGGKRWRVKATARDNISRQSCKEIGSGINVFGTITY